MSEPASTTETAKPSNQELAATIRVALQARHGGERKTAALQAFDEFAARVEALLAERDAAESDAKMCAEAVVDAHGRVAVLEAALRDLLDDAVDRWHETCPNEERGLHEWLGLTLEQFADYVQDGVEGFVRARCAVLAGGDAAAEEKP